MGSNDFPAGARPCQPTQHCTLAFVAKLNPAGTGLVYATYLGGTGGGCGGDWATAIAVDGAHNAYLTGLACSPDFPKVRSSRPCGRYEDAFVAKLNATGSALAYATCLGGSDPLNRGEDIGNDRGQGIAVDRSGNAYVTGVTFSNDFPTVKPSMACTQGRRDAFVAKLNAKAALVSATCLGGGDDDVGYAIAVDRSGNPYVAGSTESAGDFPEVNNGAVQPAPPCPPDDPGCTNTGYGGGLTDAFITKLVINAKTGRSSIAYSSYLGGSGDDEAWAIALDPAGNAYLTGWTRSTDFPTTVGAQQEDAAHVVITDAQREGFAVQLSSTVNAATPSPHVVYSTYLGLAGSWTAQPSPPTETATHT